MDGGNYVYITPSSCLSTAKSVCVHNRSVHLFLPIKFAYLFLAFSQTLVKHPYKLTSLCLPLPKTV